MYIHVATICRNVHSYHVNNYTQGLHGCNSVIKMVPSSYTTLTLELCFKSIALGEVNEFGQVRFLSSYVRKG